jgi:hypothetical protein
VGKRIVRVSNELLKEFFVEGRTFPARNGSRIRVTAGIPADAELEAVSGELYCATGETALRFRSPSWEGPAPGCATPEIRVEYVEEFDVSSAQLAGDVSKALADFGGVSPVSALGGQLATLEAIERANRAAFGFGPLSDQLIEGADYTIPPPDAPDAPHVVTGD